MESFREFEAGPDPFGHIWQVQFQWLLTAISLRHSDSVDVKFILRRDDTKLSKTVVDAASGPARTEREDVDGRLPIPGVRALRPSV